MTKRYPLPEGLTPQLLSRQAAAAYFGVSPIIFGRLVMEQASLAPLRIGSQKRWDVKVLRAWLDRQSGLATIAVPDGEERWDG